jgi:hypothetical protein
LKNINCLKPNGGSHEMALIGNSLKAKIVAKISDSCLIVKKKRVLGIKASETGLAFDRPESGCAV